MSLNDTPSADRTHIGIFGRRNAGKSSLINALTGQDLAIVSEVRGTTTDPVSKAMELLPLGPVVMIDTPGIDDAGDLGAMRVRKSYQVLNKTDIALLVVDGEEGFGPQEAKLLARIGEKEIPCVVAVNKAERMTEEMKRTVHGEILAGGIPEENLLYVSAADGTNISPLKERIAAQMKDESAPRLVGDLLKPGDQVVLVVPIDSAAPKGRLILPQQQTIRDVRDADAAAIVTKENRVRETLHSLTKAPAMVITDSQAFERVARDTPTEIPLTSFSILMARRKGDLPALAHGAAALDHLKDGDRVLISEGCTHHRQCGDIGTEKLPRWIQGYTGKALTFSFTSGTEFPEDLQAYALCVHCGGCMLHDREMRYRIHCAQDQGVPITNYGVCIAKIHGILPRSLQPFPAALAALQAPVSGMKAEDDAQEEERQR